jgi:hypothetical protein
VYEIRARWAGALDSSRRDSMLDDITVGVIAFVFVASAFLCAFLCDVFQVRREQRASYLPRAKRTTGSIKMPSGIAE